MRSLASLSICLTVATAASSCGGTLAFQRPATSTPPTYHARLARPAFSRSRPSPTPPARTDPNPLFATAGSDEDGGDPYARYTHQIGIPLSESTDLHEALRAVQTSLIRDCPRLIRACIVPALLRLPLLYVDASSISFGRSGGGGASVGGDDAATALIGKAVDRAIREVMYGEGGGEDGVFVGGTGPILLPFRGLELEGDDNNVLYAVATGASSSNANERAPREDEEDGVIVVDDWGSSATSANDVEEGAGLLRRLAERIQHELEEVHGLDTRWPSDEPQGSEVTFDDAIAVGDDSGDKEKWQWRPRVPFVRLPPDFYDGLRDGNNDKGALLDIESGADGISPLFWYEDWAEREILGSPGARMRGLAVYKRTANGGGEDEASFYVPTSTIIGEGSGGGGAGGRVSLDLPAGDGRLAAKERKEKDDAMGRMSEEERKAEEEWEEDKAKMEKAMFGGGGERSLSSLEAAAVAAEEDDMENVSVEGSASYSAIDDAQTGETRPLRSAADEVTIDISNDGTSPKVTVERDAMGQRRTKKDLPNIESNPVFQRLWKGESQIDSRGRSGSAQKLDSGDGGAPEEEAPPLPPYPSEPHFVGIWRVVSSPLGPTASTPEERVLGLGGTGSTTDTETETSSCDNLVLRVDGTIMGGPVLDAETMQKAAGGTWNMFQAVRRGAVSDEQADGEDVESKPMTRMRVRMLIPPEKKKYLVMEGEVNRLVMPGGGTTSENSMGDGGVQLASSGEAFGVDFGDMSPSTNTGSTKSSSSGGDALLYCGGEAWLEDADGGGNRRKIGPFSLMKLKTPDRRKLIYTVPASKVGPSDEDDEDLEP